MFSYNLTDPQVDQLRTLMHLYPLHTAVFNNDSDTVSRIIAIQQDSYLLNRILNLDVVGISRGTQTLISVYQNITPLEAAILQGGDRVFSVLLQSDLINIETISTCFPGKTPLQVSIIRHNTSSFAGQILLRSKSKNASNLPLHAAYLNYRDQDGNTAAHFAAEKGFDNFLDLLALDEANLNVRNARGYTPVQAAVMCRQYGTAIHLLSLPGVQLDRDTQEDDLSFSIIQEAVFEDNSSLLDAILNNNPEITHTVEEDLKTNENEYIPLTSFAATNDAVNCLRSLERRGHVLDPSLQDYIEDYPEAFPKVYSYLFSDEMDN